LEITEMENRDGIIVAEGGNEGGCGAGIDRKRGRRERERRAMVDEKGMGNGERLRGGTAPEFKGNCVGHLDDRLASRSVSIFRLHLEIGTHKQQRPLQGVFHAIRQAREEHLRARSRDPAWLRFYKAYDHKEENSFSLFLDE
jgi:hypothetical protein